MTEQALLEKIDRFLEDFLSLPETKRYLALKDAVEKDGRLASLLSEVQALQQEARKAPYDKRKALLERAKALHDRYEDDPLVVNLRSGREVLLCLLEPIRRLTL